MKYKIVGVRVCGCGEEIDIMVNKKLNHGSMCFLCPSCSEEFSFCFDTRFANVGEGVA